MTVAELVASIACADPGGYLRVVDDETIEYCGPRGLLTDALRAEIRRRKTDIVAWLRTPADVQPREDRLLFDYDPNTLPPEWSEAAQARPSVDTSDVREMLRAFTSSGIDLRLHGDLICCRIPRWDGWQRVVDGLRDRRQEIQKELMRSPAAGRMKEGSFPTDINSTVEVTV